MIKSGHCWIKWDTDVLYHIQMPVRTQVRTGVDSLMGGQDWHFTAQAIIPTITSWHFCIRLIFRPLSQGSVSVWFLRVSIQSGPLILLFTTTANICSSNLLPSAVIASGLWGFQSIYVGTGSTTATLKGLNRVTALSPCSHFSGEGLSRFIVSCFLWLRQEHIKCRLGSHNSSLNQRQSLSSIDIPLL